MPDQDTATRLARVKSGADWITKIGGACAVIAMLGGGVAGALVPFARDYLGISDLTESVESVQGDMDGIRASIETFRVEVRRAINRIAPEQVVAIYDDSETYQLIKKEYPCRPGTLCAVRYRLKRTPFGKTCGAPELSPYVRNHGSVLHSVEALSPSVEMGEEWDYVLSTFRVPRAAQCGRATYGINLMYQCATGEVRDKATKVPILIPCEEEPPL